ncbi:MAG: response regulator transcription factor [Ardenticatenaceae bacterium]|nr:response regulator transcription factor [Anaerolineales bacterium]MCB8940780.1 response regulator transcription factor [Ardenticatenaceae bacterium]MCB8972119.1 response regulator transcription factor [Ardenticatenaceae bacterium]
MEPIRILIADDHTLFRTGLKALFGSLAETAVVGEAESGQEAVAQAEALQPDVVLMDIQMPGLNGIDAARQIVQTSPHIGVIMVTMFEDDDSVFAAMRAGARGYVLKGADQEEMLRVIQAVARGEALFGPAIALRLTSFFNRSKTIASDAFPDLTYREQELLHLLAQGLSNQEIAARLVITNKTVRNHLSNIFNKMQVTDRVQAIIQARNAGLG